MTKPKLVSLPVSNIRPREDDEPLDQATVDWLAESLPREGQIVPLIVVMRGEGRNKHALTLVGNHRLAAAQKAGLAELLCLVIEGVESSDMRKAIIVAENLIRQHYSDAKRAAKLTDLVALRTGKKEAEKTSQAVEAPVSPRKETFATVSQNPPLKTGGRPLSPKGEAIREVAKEHRVPEKTLRKAVERKERRSKAEKEAEAERDAIVSADEKVCDERGQEIPEHLVGRWQMRREVTAEIGKLLRAVQVNLGKLAEDFDPKSWSQTQATLRAEWGAIKVRLPFALCAWCKGLKADCQSCHGYGFDTENDQQTTPKELLA